MASFSEKHKGPADLAHRVVYIVGPGRVENELLASLLRQKTRAVCLTKENMREIEVLSDESIEAPRLVFLDCLGKDAETLLVELESIDTKMFSRDLVVLYNLRPGLGIEKEAIARGIRGIYHVREPLDRFQQGIRAIFRGELWVSGG